MTCYYGCGRPIDLDWDPYCGAHCAIDSERWFTQHVSLGTVLKPAWEALQRAKRPCWPKVSHLTYGHALIHAQALVSRGVAGHVERLRIYKCACGGYHIGHRPGGV